MLKWNCCTNGTNKSDGQSFSDESDNSQKDKDFDQDNKTKKGKKSKKQKKQIQPQIEQVQVKPQNIGKIVSNEKLKQEDNQKKISSELKIKEKSSEVKLEQKEILQTPKKKENSEKEIKNGEIQQMMLQNMSQQVQQQNLQEIFMKMKIELDQLFKLLNLIKDDLTLVSQEILQNLEKQIQLFETRLQQLINQEITQKMNVNIFQPQQAPNLIGDQLMIMIGQFQQVKQIFQYIQNSRKEMFQFVQTQKQNEEIANEIMKQQNDQMAQINMMQNIPNYSQNQIQNQQYIEQYDPQQEEQEQDLIYEQQKQEQKNVDIKIQADDDQQTMFDAESILRRAPKLIINNIDPVNQILPQEKLFVNAFGVVDGIRNFNYIPLEIQQTLSNLQKNQMFLQSNLQNQNQMLTVQQNLLFDLLLQQQHLQLSNLNIYFGSKNKVKEQNINSFSMQGVSFDNKQQNLQKGQKQNGQRDVILKNDETIGKNHFRIRFCPYQNTFYIKDMGEGSGTFVRIEESTVLKTGSVICAGESQIIVGIIFDNLCENKHEDQQEQNQFNQNRTNENEIIQTQLMLKFIRGPRIAETMKFITDDAPILIGRNFDCHIQIASDETISRYQAKIDYIDNRWILRDGNSDNIKQKDKRIDLNFKKRISILEQKAQEKLQNDNEIIGKSTNGTWIFCNQEEELKGEQIIKIGSSFIQTKVFNPL